MGSDKAASKFLNDLGFVGISYPAQYRSGGRADGARNYVIFNEDDAQIVENVRFRRPISPIDEVNERFNEQLAELTVDNAQSSILSLGSPSNILQAAGVTNKPMRLYGNKVMKKARKHGFALEELRDLPNAVATHIAVFNNIEREGNRSILTELKTSQGNILVTIDLGKGGDVDFNIVSSVFGKSDNKIINWINKGYATYIDKEKALNYLRIPAPIAGAQSNQELNSATKIVENFENPTIESENNLDIPEESVRFRMGDSRSTFDERVQNAAENNGTVMPNLPNLEVLVVKVPKHTYKGTAVEAKKQAMADAVDKYQGKVLHYNNRGVEFDYTIGKENINKSMSKKAIEKSANMGVHIAVLNHLDEVISESIEVEEHPDYNKTNEGTRSPENGYNPEVLIHRFYGAVEIDDAIYRVKTTMREYMDSNRKNTPYTYEVTNVELLSAEAPSSSNGVGLSDNGLSFPTTKLLENVEKSYDKGKKVLDESENNSDTAEENIRFRVNSNGIPLSERAFAAAQAALEE